MPRQANGTYVAPSNTAAVSGQTISSTAFNTLETDIGSEITNSVDRLGRSAMQANLPMGGYLINNLGTPAASTDAATKGYADTQDAATLASAVALLTGAVMPFAMNSAPSGWLAADGSAVSRTTYAALFAKISTTYGAGDGSTTFNLPDMRGYFVRGSGTNSDGTASGTFGAKQADDVKPHNHTITDPGHFHNVQYLNAYAPGAGGGMIGPLLTGNQNQTASATTGITINNSTGTETRPKNVALLYCIKT